MLLAGFILLLEFWIPQESPSAASSLADLFDLPLGLVQLEIEKGWPPFIEVPGLISVPFDYKVPPCVLELGGHWKQGKSSNL